MKSGVIWITGLSGSGKTTVAGHVVQGLKEKGLEPLFLDGDRLREALGPEFAGDLHNSRESRLALALRYGQMCQELAQQGRLVVIATISMFHEVHNWNRAHLPHYFEVFLRVPLSELRRRDPKSIYHRFDQGKLSNVAGLDLKVDEPTHPDLLFEFDASISAEKIAEKVVHRYCEGESR